MRLWTLHPRYLDARGLVALWREALLAQAVLAERTRGYRQHPQLIRFRDCGSPQEAIAGYLSAVHAEATHRGYRFDAGKIGAAPGCEPLLASSGQIDYEWQHLAAKLRLRAPAWLARWDGLVDPEPHPLFQILPGAVAQWEIRQPPAAG